MKFLWVIAGLFIAYVIFIGGSTFLGPALILVAGSLGLAYLLNQISGLLRRTIFNKKKHRSLESLIKQREEITSRSPGVSRDNALSDWEDNSCIITGTLEGKRYSQRMYNSDPHWSIDIRTEIDAQFISYENPEKVITCIIDCGGEAGEAESRLIESLEVGGPARAVGKLSYTREYGYVLHVS